MPLFCVASAAVLLFGSRAYAADLARADALAATIAAN
jgi:hypothetical protein